LRLKGIERPLYTGYVNCLIHASEIEEKQCEKKLDTTEVNMFRWVCGYKLKERIRNAEIKERLEPVNMVLKRDRLTRFRHVERKDEVDWVKACMTTEVDETRQMGRTTKT